MKPEHYLNDRRTKPRALCYPVEIEIISNWRLVSKNQSKEIHQRDNREITIEKNETSFQVTIGNLVYLARNAFPFVRLTIGTPNVTEYISDGNVWLKELMDKLKLY